MNLIEPTTRKKCVLLVLSKKYHFILWIKKQLQYVRRDLHYIDEYISRGMARLEKQSFDAYNECGQADDLFFFRFYQIYL